MPTIYVLQCEKGRYYVGKTDRPFINRIAEHFASHGSEWTRKYKPLRIVKTFTDAEEGDEDKITKQYMSEYGIDRVRGGTYCMINLKDYQERALIDELCTIQDRCFRCMRTGHFTKSCYAKTMADGSLIEDSESEEEEIWVCEKCDREFKDEFDAMNHERYCITRATSGCYRCGRKGHFSQDCYASYHVNGKRLL